MNGKSKEASVNSSKILYKNKARHCPVKVSAYSVNNSTHFMNKSKRSISKSRSPSSKKMKKKRSVSKSFEMNKKSRSKSKSASKGFLNIVFRIVK